MMKNVFREGLSNNALKIIALISMTLDHLCILIIPQVEWLRIIGRIAMPIFAYMIAEGCKYTKNKLKYFLMVFILGVICQVVYYVSDGSLLMGILIDFSISILLIYFIDYALNVKKWWAYTLAILSIIATALLVYILPEWTNGDLYFDYGLGAILLPVVIYIFNNKWLKLFATAIFLIPICAIDWQIQWFCYLALIPLALYNGKRGKYKLKYLFYLYYPIHLAVLYLIGIMI